MILDYTLSENDFLNFQLYNVSMSEQFAARRDKDRWRLPGLSLLFGLVLLFDDRESIWAYILVASSLLFFIFYKWWSAWFYKRMYKRQVEDSMKGSFPYSIKLLLDKDVIEIDSKNGHRQFSVQDIVSVSETSDYFYIMVSQMYIIVPKNNILELDVLHEQLKRYIEDLDIPYMQRLDWKWR